MNKYKYVAINLQKEKFTGTFIAENEKDLAIQLQKQELYLISCKNYSSDVKNSFFSLSIGSGKVSINEINTFARQLSIMISSGISILESLNILKNQKYSKMFRDVLEIIYDDVKSGIMFSDAIGKHKRVFPSFFRSMIAVGERSSRLDSVLNSLADYYEKDASAKRKLISAMSYPIMLAFMTVGITVLMLAYVIPTFRESLSALEVTPTGLTKVVYDISDFIVEKGLYVLAGVLGVIALIYLFSRTKNGRYMFDKLKMKLPGLKAINQARLTSRFSSSFGLLLASGMDVIDAMDAATIVFDNKYMEEKYLNAIEDVKKGSSVSYAFQYNKLFPPMLIQMIAVGEKTNSLDDVLTRSSSFFQEQVDEAISRFTSVLQPILLTLMGAIIGTLFIAIYSPMIDIMNTF